MKYRNTELVLIQKNDPGRLRTRTQAPEKEKQIKNRARREKAWRKEWEV